MKVEVHETKRLLDDFFVVDEARLQHEKFDGGMTAVVRRLNLNRGEAVAVLIYLTDIDSFVLIRQFRYAVYDSGQDGWIEEIVAGVLENDTPLECAQRECIEEAGYEIDEFEYIGPVYSSPGITTERVHMYIGYATEAHKKHPGGGLDHEHEDIEIITIPRDKALKRLQNKEFEDGKTNLALLYFFLYHINP